MAQYRRSILFVLAATLLIHLPGCGEQVEGFVYVDNGSDQPIVVEIDGQHLATIAPGKFEKIRLDLGDRHFRISRGGEVVYDQVHTLDYGDRPFHRPTFMLNPDNSNRYCEVGVVYGEDKFETQSDEAIVRLVSAVADQRDAADDDEEKRLSWELNNRMRAKFRSLKHDLIAFGDEPFFRFETYQYILEPMPNSIFISRSDSLGQETLIRVPKQLHDFVYSQLQIEKPTVAEVAQLLQTQELLQSLIPVAGQ